MPPRVGNGRRPVSEGQDKNVIQPRIGAKGEVLVEIRKYDDVALIKLYEDRKYLSERCKTLRDLHNGAVDGICNLLKSRRSICERANANQRKLLERIDGLEAKIKELEWQSPATSSSTSSPPPVQEQPHRPTDIQRRKTHLEQLNRALREELQKARSETNKVAALERDLQAARDAKAKADHDTQKVSKAQLGAHVAMLAADRLECCSPPVLSCTSPVVEAYVTEWQSDRCVRQRHRRTPQAETKQLEQLNRALREELQKARSETNKVAALERDLQAARDAKAKADHDTQKVSKAQLGAHVAMLAADRLECCSPPVLSCTSPVVEAYVTEIAASLPAAHIPCRTLTTAARHHKTIDSAALDIIAKRGTKGLLAQRIRVDVNPPAFGCAPKLHIAAQLGAHVAMLAADRLECCSPPVLSCTSPVVEAYVTEWQSGQICHCLPRQSRHTVFMIAASLPAAHIPCRTLTTAARHHKTIDSAALDIIAKRGTKGLLAQRIRVDVNPPAFGCAPKLHIAAQLGAHVAMLAADRLECCSPPVLSCTSPVVEAYVTEWQSGQICHCLPRQSRHTVFMIAASLPAAHIPCRTLTTAARHHKTIDSAALDIIAKRGTKGLLAQRIRVDVNPPAFGCAPKLQSL
ncbi:unnamed protein product [Vitrella brassicaformis CCMP3155]|uniref:Uncharacterized protein n=1 Tax=Vitrella brassicaformis (strain CCMP3155) TaxID=1169540 RepID=A0A0G4EWE3_VITBC|nr:unnamed protein product [Vitrella brassicaformis CCMP3155]|eukprot:CEM03277.1 unnamed protein product [Vitrella brassicaformis CCMP3155]